jgi:PKD repeat protein
MKVNSLVIFIFVIVLSSASEESYSQAQRLVLIEQFTNASCVPCSEQNPAFNALLSANTSKVISLKHQTAYPGYDPINLQNPTEVNIRYAYYNGSSVPNARMDGIAGYGSPEAFTQGAINAQYAVPAPFSINLKHWLFSSNDSIVVYCEVTAAQNTTLLSGKLRIAMMEKQIQFSSAPGSNGEREFRNVMRKFYPNVNGINLANNWVNGQKKVISFKAKIPSYIYNISQIAMVAYIQDDADKSVKQAGYSPNATIPLTVKPVTDFASNLLTTCEGTIRFTDESALFPTQWLWDFGDNTTSTQKNPLHTYAASGTYTVKLTATNAFGSEQITKTNLITVALTGNPPTGSNVTFCTSGIANLSAQPDGNGLLKWYNSAGVLVNSGNTYSPTVNATTNYYVREEIPNSVTSVGPANTNIEAGSFYNSNELYGLYFNVTEPCLIKSFDVRANSAGTRNIVVADANGFIVKTANVSIPAGASTVTVNFQMDVGTGYLLVVYNSVVDLYYNTAGGNYPYTTNGLKITGNTALGDPDNYYFFYNWKVQKNPCASSFALVSAIKDCSVSIDEDEIDGEVLSAYPNPISSGSITLSYYTPTFSNYHLSAFNVLGKLVYQETFNSSAGSNTRSIDISQFAKGVYNFALTSEQNQETIKVIIH